VETALPVAPAPIFPVAARTAVPVFWNGATFSGVRRDDAKIDRAEALDDPTAGCSS